MQAASAATATVDAAAASTITPPAQLAAVNAAGGEGKHGFSQPIVSTHPLNFFHILPVGNQQAANDAAASARIIAAQNAAKADALTQAGASASLAAVAAAEASLAAITQSVGGAVSLRY